MIKTLYVVDWIDLKNLLSYAVQDVIEKPDHITYGDADFTLITLADAVEYIVDQCVSWEAEIRSAINLNLDSKSDIYVNLEM